MIAFWTTLTVLAILFMVASVLILLFLFGHDKGRELSRSLQIAALFLLVLNSGMLLVPTTQFVDMIITTRLLLKSAAAFMLSISFLLELKHVLEKEKTPKAKSSKTKHSKTKKSAPKKKRK